MSKHLKFGVMIATSTAVMLALMYLHTCQLDHVFWSETRFFMALIMGAGMVIMMRTSMRRQQGAANNRYPAIRRREPSRRSSHSGISL